jgi:hypothetical protein
MRKVVVTMSLAFLLIAIGAPARAEVRSYVCPEPDGTQGTLIIDTQKHTFIDTEGSSTCKGSYRGSNVITYLACDTLNTLDLTTGRTTHKQSSDTGWVVDSPCVRR